MYYSACKLQIVITHTGIKDPPIINGSLIMVSHHFYKYVLEIQSWEQCTPSCYKDGNGTKPSPLFKIGKSENKRGKHCWGD